MSSILRPALRRGLLASVLLLASLITPGIGSSVEYSPDITHAPGGTVVADEDVADDDGAGTVTPVPVGPVPAGADVNAYALLASGGSIVSFDSSTLVPGLGALAKPNGLVTVDATGTFFISVISGAIFGIPASARIDALTVNALGELMFSLDITTSLPAVGTVHDEDLVLFSGGVLSLFFDGSLHGVSESLDLDAAHRSTTGDDLMVSFDTAGIVGGIPFEDEDVLAFDTVALTWTMFQDSSVSDPIEWPPADLVALVALPEPGRALSLLAGLALLFWLRPGRAQSSRR